MICENDLIQWIGYDYISNSDIDEIVRQDEEKKKVLELGKSVLNQIYKNNKRLNFVL